jgi:undecaprenyl-diphosphatase
VLYGAIALAVQSCTRNTVARVFAWSAAVAVTVSVGLSRVYRGMHHPTDVIVGAAFGVACLWVATRSVRAGSATPESTGSTAATGERAQCVPIESEVLV